MCIKNSDGRTRRKKREREERQNLITIAIPSKFLITKYAKYF